MNKYALSLITGIAFTIVFASTTIFAGYINDNESAIIEIISGNFEKDGVIYKAKDKYIAMAIEYLNQDDVNLTGTQRDKAITAIYDNIEAGIEGGYLEPILSAPENASENEANFSENEANSSENEANSSSGNNAGESNNMESELIDGTSEAILEIPEDATEKNEESLIISMLEFVAEHEERETTELPSDLDIYVGKASIVPVIVYILIGGLWISFLIMIYLANRYHLLCQYKEQKK